MGNHHEITKTEQNLDCRGGLTLQEFMTLSKTELQRRQQENPRWCRIEYQGTTGWVEGYYLAEGSCADSVGGPSNKTTGPPELGTAGAE